jgi:hypothetical protein
MIFNKNSLLNEGFVQGQPGAFGSIYGGRLTPRYRKIDARQTDNSPIFEFNGSPIDSALNDPCRDPVTPARFGPCSRNQRT